MCANYWENAAKCSTHDSHTHLYTCMYMYIYTQALSLSLFLSPSPSFSPHTHTLTVVDSSLPESLKHLVSNAEYYGPSIYLPGTSVLYTWLLCMCHCVRHETFTSHKSHDFWCTYKVINRGCLHIRSSSVSVCKSMCCSINTLFSTCMVPGCCRGSLHTGQIGHFGY